VVGSLRPQTADYYSAPVAGNLSAVDNAPFPRPVHAVGRILATVAHAL
jgi:hypothetical protein